jgi:Flp pilus assembly protein TadG
VRRDLERGASLVELALVLPILLVVLLGALDLGRGVYVRTALATAARDGARFASVDPTNVACIGAAAISRAPIPDLTVADVTVTPPLTIDLGESIRVEVETTYRPLSALMVGIAASDAITLRAAATMQIRSLPAAPLLCP